MSVQFILGSVALTIVPVVLFFLLPKLYENNLISVNRSTLNAILIVIMVFGIGVFSILVAHGSVESLLHKESLDRHNFQKALDRFIGHQQDLSPSVPVAQLLDFSVQTLRETERVNDNETTLFRI